MPIIKLLCLSQVLFSRFEVIGRMVNTDFLSLRKGVIELFGPAFSHGVFFHLVNIRY